MICRNIRHNAVKTPRYEISLRNNRSFCLSNDWRQEAKLNNKKKKHFTRYASGIWKKNTNKVDEDLTVKSRNDPI